MQIDERSRRQMYERLEAVLGAQTADALMEHLPPVGWADVTTKRDLDVLRVATKRDLDVLRADIGALESSMDALEHRLLAQMHGEINRLIMWFVPTMLSGVGLAFAAARFA